MVAEAQEVATQGSFITTLGLNGTLFVAQLVNFGIILFIMWRFVYRPLLAAMDERTRKITQGLLDAKNAAALKDQMTLDRDKAIRTARVESQRILEEAQASAKQERESMITKAKQEIERLVVDAKLQLQREKEQMVQDVVAEVGELVIAATSRVASEKLDAKKDAKLIEQSIKSVRV